MKKKITIIGAGPGGLAAAMLLLSKGYEVDIYEKEAAVGGRTGRFFLGDYIFDIGPTFLMLPQYMEEIFRLSGRNLHDYVEITPLDPLYRLKFEDGTEFYPSMDMQKTLSEIKRVFPDQLENYLRFRHDEHYRFNRIERCFKSSYDSVFDFFRPSFLEALPQMDAAGSLRGRLEKYFTEEKMRLAMTFQTKYIGMSPWQAPSAYSLISYIEYQWGIHHVTGGLNRLTLAMAKVIEEFGGRIHTSTMVKGILTRGKKAAGICLENGREIKSDYVIVNADFSYAMSKFLNDRKKYTDADLKKREYSCSTFMLYLGINKQYDIPHHNLIFGEDFKEYMDEITLKRRPSAASLVYIHNPAVTDHTLAPKGKSPIYILVPVPNNKASINWDDLKHDFRRQVLDFISAKTELKDIESSIEQEKIVTPLDWERDFNVYNGAVFNLSHDLNQMFYFRPHNRSEELSNCYITGGGTHPGSGLPNICISSVITSELLIRADSGDRRWRFDNKVYL
ncbi:phytoene desaturase family protein [Candidatus Magnetominusculus xianensis]|uniref:Phytoene desaturase n=1 Tax=Candidatus Magnetominusculus xianensis TaxID=1748249 RepID=A0ABR5SHV1_9BACT|nr:phytoene desaturase family protein [Candidatus Magnetominusculus xianensis]KWT91811.1 phytoene desaturase [Candidatus Magnetominusculus xianensis]MBF0403867.1 phytoene desaturase [Nitrospirota bacterium]